MQFGNVDNSKTDLLDFSLGAESLRAASMSAEPANAQSIYQKTKASFEHAMNSPKISNAMLEKLLEEFNELAEAFNVQLRFNVKEEGPNHISVKIVNIETNEVIREIPPKKFSAVGSKVLDAVGIVVDEMA